MEGFKFFAAWLSAHKGKIGLTILAFVGFLVVLFPFDDLSDLVSREVAKATQNQVFIQFDKMELSLLSGAGIALENVIVETGKLPAIRAQELQLTPSLGGLLSGNPAGSVEALGLMGGEVSASLGSGGVSEKGNDRKKLDFSAENLSLDELRKLGNVPVALQGKLNLTSQALADLTFTEQPEADIQLSIKDFVVPPANIRTAIDTIGISGFKLQGIDLKGRLADGLFLIEDGRIGKEGDEIKGTIKGRMGLQLKNQNGKISQVLGGYNLEIDLIVKKSFQEREKLLLFLLEAYKQPAGPDADRYAVKISANNPFLPPSIGALR
ncbi:MAG: type II secretion system protein GspN [Pseudobdellovibrionaceae bacterium]